MTTTRTEIGAPTQDAEREEPAGATAVGAEVPPPHPSSRQLGLPWPRRRGALTTVLSLLLTLVVLGHAWIPNTFGHLGSLVETLLPWTALGIPALLAPAVLRKSLVAVVAVALLTAGWLAGLRRHTRRQVVAGRGPHRGEPQRQPGQPRPTRHGAEPDRVQG